MLTYDGTVSSYGFAHPREEMRPQLFDLIADPHETNNLAKENPEIVANMAAQINQWNPLEKAKALTSWE